VPIDQGSLAKEIAYGSHAVGQYATSRAGEKGRGAETRTAAPDDLAQVTRGTLVSRTRPNWKMVSAPT